MYDSHVLKTPFRKVLQTLQPAAIAGLAMSIAVWGSQELTSQMTPFIQLSVGIAVGAIVYSAILFLLQREMVIEAGNTLRMALSRR
jgi:preprotein translocase subunit Sec61beta